MSKTGSVMFWFSSYVELTMYQQLFKGFTTTNSIYLIPFELGMALIPIYKSENSGIEMMASYSKVT